MADYCTTADVIQTMPSGASLTALTRPDLVAAAGWIASASAQADVALTKGGTTLPITDAALLALLKIRVAREVAYQVMTARGGWGPGNAPPFWAKWHDEFEAMLEEMGTVGSVSVVGSTTGVPWSYTMDAEPGSADAEKKLPKIERAQEW